MGGLNPSKKLVIVSTRLPVSVTKKDGKLYFESSPGGLATGVSTISKDNNSIWVGWPGISTDEITKKEQDEIVDELKKYNCHPVFLTADEVENYYLGYCNETLWPLFHYFTEMTGYNRNYWEAYKNVNELFYKQTRKYLDKDTQVWVHDYQLMLLPEIIKKKHKNSLIGFFLHTPFPSFEIFRLLPERKEILCGLLGADLVGFHTYDYVRHFLSSVNRVLGYENILGMINIESRRIQSDAFPIGIDYKKFSISPKKYKVKKLVKSFDVFDKHRKVILSIDRADYSKGIPERLDAYELFLKQNPKYHGEVVLILLAVPSRSEVEAYKKLRQEIEQKVSRINGTYSSVDWAPISYRYQSLPFDELTALYAMADVMLVTPLRDGMNLVAKEYVATHHKKNGVLILSEMAGVASELLEAIQVNPGDAQMVADAIVQSIEMGKKEQQQRMRKMQNRISTYTIGRWAEDFINELERTKRLERRQKQLKEKDSKKIINEYQKAKKRLILLDYDGTLRAFVDSPDDKLAHPTTRVRRIIKRLTTSKKNRVVIVSGRPKKSLLSFFSNKRLWLVAEHGGWLFNASKWTKAKVTSRKWKKTAKPLLNQFVSRTPGALLEEKDFSLVWHYRHVSPDLAYVRKEELEMELHNILNGGDIGIFEGEKVVEVKPKNLHKGSIVKEQISQESWDFVLCIGDDYTDEDMFKALPERAYAIHVGDGETEAGLVVDSVKDVVELLDKLK